MTYPINEFVYGITAEQIIEEIDSNLSENERHSFSGDGYKSLDNLCSGWSDDRDDVFINYYTGGGDYCFVAGTKTAPSSECHEGNKGGLLLKGINARLSTEKELEVKTSVLEAVAETRKGIRENEYTDPYEQTDEYKKSEMYVLKALDAIEKLTNEGKMDYAVIISSS
jgi:hypothetical protein